MTWSDVVHFRRRNGADVCGHLGIDLATRSRVYVTCEGCVSKIPPLLEEQAELAALDMQRRAA